MAQAGKCCLSCVLLIVVACLLSCKETTCRLNEVGAQSSLRLIRKAESTYRSQDSQHRFGTLLELHARGLIEAELASGTKDGYRYQVNVGNDSFTAIATPLEYDVTGSWSFYVDESGVIRGSVTRGKLPDVNDRPVRYQ